MRFSHELRLYLWNNPAVVLVFEATRGFKVVDIPRVGYLINDPAVATQMLTHPNFTSAGRGGMGSMITPVVGEDALFNMDGPRHTQLKQQMVKIFSRQYIDLMIEESLSETLARLRADLLAGRTVDFVGFTADLSTRLTLHMLGIQVQGERMGAFVHEISETIAYITSFFALEHVEIPPESLGEVQARYARVQAIIDEYGSYQPNALLYRLQEGMGLDERNARGLIAVILAAGTETTNATLPRILALLLDTGQYDKLRQNRALMGRAIDEGLRVTSASPAIIRAIEADTELGPYTFKAGRRAIAVLYNLLKHGDHAPNPRKFDIERQIPPAIKHMSFGRGPHFCLGFPLVSREVEVVLETLLDTPGTPQIVRRRYPFRETFPGYRALDIRLEPPR